MRMGNYGAMAALGITRVGDNDTGIVRQISMAGFGALPQGNDPGPDHESNYRPNFPCAKDMNVKAPWSTYCGCMYGDADRISSDKKSSDDFATGSARWACQKTAEINLNPWTCEGILSTVTLSMGKADPLRHMDTAAKLAEYRRCAEKVGRNAQPIIDLLKATGALPMNAGQTGAQPVTGGSSTPNPSTGARPVPDGFFRPRPVSPFLPPRVDPKSAMPVGLIAGVGVAAVAALFLLKK